MKRWINIIFTPGASVASVPLVFLSVVIVIAFQLPAQLLMRRGYMMWGIAVNEIIAILGVPLLIVFLFGFDRKKLFPLRLPSLGAILMLIIFTVAADVLIDYLTYASELILSPPPDVIEGLEKLIAIDGPSILVAKLFVLCLLPGICEEVFFRGFCQGSLEAKWGRWVALLTASILFALLHGNPWYFHLYFILGLIMGWLYIISKTLIIPIAFHVMNNAWTITVKAYNLGPPVAEKFGIYDFF